MSHNTWLHRIIRRPVQALATTRVRPNHLTTGRLATGFAAAWGFGSGDTALVAAGAAMMVLSILLDRADGELARVQQSASPFGHVYDIITDAAVNAAVMVGIGIGTRGGMLGDWALLLGLVAGAAVAYVLVMMVRFERGHGTGAIRFEGAGGFDADDAMLFIPLAMLLGWNEILLVLAAVGAPTAAVVVTVLLRRRRDFA